MRSVPQSSINSLATPNKVAIQNPEVSKTKAWILATRPKTLWAAFVPVVLGSSIAYYDNMFVLWVALATLVISIGIQVATNFVNDISDFEKGADSDSRQGPLRVIQAGLLSKSEMKRAIVAVFTFSFLLGLVLVYRAGWPLLAIGICSIISGILYTAGPKPLGYIGLGDLFVLVFFGPVAVAGTYFAQAMTWSNESILIGLAPGLFSVALLAVNNLRDIDEDRLVNKKTLAVRFGRGFARWEYIVCICGACLLPMLLYISSGNHRMSIAASFAILFSIPAFKIVLHETGGEKLNPILGQTAKIALAFNLGLAILWHF